MTLYKLQLHFTASGFGSDPVRLFTDSSAAIRAFEHTVDHYRRFVFGESTTINEACEYLKLGLGDSPETAARAWWTLSNGTRGNLELSAVEAE